MRYVQLKPDTMMSLSYKYVIVYQAISSLLSLKLTHFILQNIRQNEFEHLWVRMLHITKYTNIINLERHTLYKHKQYINWRI